MIGKGLLAIVGGFIFIFSPGIPMRLFSRFRPDYNRTYLYWGIGFWIIAFLASSFLQSLARQIVTGGQVSGLPQYRVHEFGISLAGALLTAILMQIGMTWMLRRNMDKDKDLSGNGLALGFGVGMIAQVFTGLVLIGAGIRLVFGNTAEMNLQEIASQSTIGIFLAVASLILFRMALLGISAIQGYLVSRSIHGQKANFWLAAGLAAGFAWLGLLLQALAGERNPGQITLGQTSLAGSLVSLSYYLVIFILAYRWLSRELEREARMVNKN